ncbi:hypothetical protein TYRP_016703 [Tyrophagus putrescentiae]|nr:hypothetical protein TYRP_016703 [Tyrophagus putrescentiae]
MLGSALAPTTADWMEMLSLHSQRSYTTSSETFMLTTLFFNALKKTEGLRGPCSSLSRTSRRRSVGEVVKASMMAAKSFSRWPWAKSESMTSMTCSTISLDGRPARTLLWRLRYEAFSELASALVFARHLRLDVKKKKIVPSCEEDGDEGVGPVRLTNVVPMLRLV